MHRYFVALGLLAAAVACGGDDDDEGSSPSARLRLVNAAPAQASIDLYVDDSQTPTLTVAYGQASDYRAIPVGAHTLTARLSGQGASSMALATLPFEAVLDAKTTLVAGPAVNGDGITLPFVPEVVSLTAFADGFATPAPGKARVRLVNAQSLNYPLGIDINADGAAEATLPDFEASAPEGVEVTAAAPFEFAVDGFFIKLGAYTVPALEDGSTNYIVMGGRFDRDNASPDGMRLFVVPSTGPVVSVLQDPQIYVVHGGLDTGDMSLTLGDVPLATGVGFGSMVGPLQRSSGTPVAHFFNAPVLVFELPAFEELAPGSQQLVILGGLLSPKAGEPALTAIVPETAPTGPGRVRYRAFHAAAAPALDLVEEGQGGVLSPILVNATFGTSTAPAGVAISGVGPLRVIQHGTMTELLDVTVSPNNGSTIFDQYRWSTVLLGSTAIGAEKPLAALQIEMSLFVWQASR